MKRQAKNVFPRDVERHMPQMKEKQSNELPLPQQGDHNARQAHVHIYNLIYTIHSSVFERKCRSYKYTTASREWQML